MQEKVTRRHFPEPFSIAFFSLSVLTVFLTSFLYYALLGYPPVMGKRSICYTAFCSLLVMLPYVIFKRQKFWTFIGLFLYEGMLLINIAYYRTYDTIFPLYAFAQESNLNGLGSSILDSYRLVDLFFVLPPIALACLYYLIVKKRRKRVSSYKVRAGFVSAFAVLLFATVVLDSINCKNTFGSYDYCYHIFYWDPTANTADFSPVTCWIWQFGQLIGSGSLSQEEQLEIESWGKYNQYNLGNLKAGRVTRNRNFVLIIVESLESWPIGRKVEDIEITPRLNSLIKEGNSIYAPLVCPQTKDGRSSDTQILINTGLFPINEGAVFFRFAHDNYYSIAKALKEKFGSSTATFICNKPSFWNQGSINPSLGFDKIYSSLNFDMNDIEGMGLSDGSMFRQSLPIIKRMKQPFFAELVTLSSHGPFELSEGRAKIEFDDDMSKELSNYLQAINYTDSAIGSFIDGLKASGLYDKTTVLIVGDHEALTKDVRARLLKDKYGRLCVNPGEFVPMIILNSPFKENYGHRMGQIDIYPTMLDILGLNQYRWRGLGRSIFSPLKKDFVIGARLNVIGDTEGCSPFEIKHAKEAWKVSDLLIKGNYFKNHTPR